MPKMKTKSSAKKRFKVTATGKVKVKKAGLRHILTKKSRNNKRAKRAASYVHPAMMHNALAVIPYGLTR
jgi:large subunit ribosomal protein L35